MDVAEVGTASAVAWSQRTFQVDCKTLASNAYWWKQFNLLDIAFDETAFRSCKDGSYQQSLVPILLQRTSMDLMTSLEFSRAYHIDGI
jgi:hypothetical protein